MGQQLKRRLVLDLMYRSTLVGWLAFVLVFEMDNESMSSCNNSFWNYFLGAVCVQTKEMKSKTVRLVNVRQFLLIGHNIMCIHDW